MKKFLAFFCILSIVCPVIYASSGAPYAQTKVSGSIPDDEIRSVLNDVYNVRFDQAESKIKTIQNKYPDDVKGYFYGSVIYFYKAISSRDDNMFEKYISLADIVIEKCESILDKDDNNIEALYYKGQSHSYKSLLMLSLNKNLLSAASNGNTGYRILSDLVEKRPDFYDAYMGLGLYKIAIGFVPEKFQWLLSIIGFKGNINNGIEMLRVAEQKGKYTKVDSKVFLSFFAMNEREENNSESIGLTKQLVEDYPESPVFKTLHAGFLMQDYKIDECISILNQALDQNKNSLQKEVSKGIYLLLGSAYFRKEDYVNAIKNLEENIKLEKYDDRYNVSLFTLGVSYEMTGNRQKAVEIYKKVRKDFIDERDGESEKFFYRLAQEKINEPYSKYDYLLLKAENLRESGEFDKSINSINDALNSDEYMKNISQDNLIKLYTSLAHSYERKRDDQNAEMFFLKAVTLKPNIEQWMIPHSYFELGKIYARRGERSKANQNFDKIYDYSDYDFKDFLEMRLANFKAKNKL